jgi:hypothetical protein
MYGKFQGYIFILFSHSFFMVAMVFLTFFKTYYVIFPVSRCKHAFLALT